jgi:galactosamine-6-phosphate isomerase
MMQLIITENYTTLCEQACQQLLQLANSITNPLLCTASGDSPAGLYKLMVQQIIQKDIPCKQWKFISLDEWAGMNGADEGSCRYHLNQQLFHPLMVTEPQVIFFDGRYHSPDEECKRIEKAIQQQGGIDIAILGLGMNGHIGMNEPGTPAGIRSHVSKLDVITTQTGQKYFSSPRQLSAGITLGLGTLLQSKHLVLLVSGSHKASILQQMLQGPITEALPGSLLRNHPHLTIYADKAAAQLLSI